MPFFRQNSCSPRFDMTVGYDGVAGEPAVALHIGSADRHDLVAVDLMAQLVDHQAAVGVAVEGHAQSYFSRHDALAEAF